MDLVFIKIQQLTSQMLLPWSSVLACFVLNITVQSGFPI